MKFRAIPQVPSGVDAQTKQFLAALKENFELLVGQRGDAEAIVELLGYHPLDSAGGTVTGSILSPNVPAFFVESTPYPTYDQSLTVGRIIGYTTYNNTVSLNNGGHFNPANGRFTIPVSGIYRFDATHTRSNGNASVVITKNGVQIAGESLSYGTDWQTAATHVVNYFDAGDYVQGVAGVRDSTTIAMYRASFSGHFIG